MKHEPTILTFCALVFGLMCSFLRAETRVPVEGLPGAYARQVEADWLRQEDVRYSKGTAEGKDVRPSDDAAGGCDGVVDGQWGFHTEHEPNPWWQVDLGQSVEIERLVVYNRCELAERASRMIVLLSDDGKQFRRVYQHDGSVFYGKSDGKPLAIGLEGERGRYVRLQLPGTSYFHLDEVEICAAGDGKNVALGRPAMQSSVSQWSKAHGATRRVELDIARVIERGLTLADDLEWMGAKVGEQKRILQDLAAQLGDLSADASESVTRGLYLRSRWAVRKMALANPLLDFDSILFVKRAPGTLPHMSDQYYGWWSRPGGGVWILDGFKDGEPRVRCLTSDWPDGSFLRPELSHDGKRVLFAYCRYYPHVSGMEKVEKDKLPADAFYNIYEMNIDGAGVRRLTNGRYDDFDARYLPGGEVVFLSTRKGQFVQYTPGCAEATKLETMPDSYVRCGGDNTRPCAVFTLHMMDRDGGNLHPISAFENFEWTPAVAHDGRILYARWDYIDRFNGHFMSLWSTNQDGTNANLVYGNYTTRPQCIFEAVSVPDSDKLVFTAAAHHSTMGGALALLDRSGGTEGQSPVTRLTPEVCFPETEGWPSSYYANPYPLSEKYFLVAWSDRTLPPHRGSAQVVGDENPVNSMGIYLYDAFGNLELLYRDPAISCMNPTAVRLRSRPFRHPRMAERVGAEHGQVLVQDVYQGLSGVKRGSIKGLRIIGVPPKVQPHMNNPHLGVSQEDPGKFVLGTVPVEADGSAYFHMPSGIPVFFQALDSQGLAVQTMRSLTYVQSGQTLACIGCHEHREQSPPVRGVPMASLRSASRLVSGPEGSWPLRFDRLVQPVLDRSCASCHSPGSDDARAASPDLTAAKAYESLLAFADKDLEKLAFERDRSEVGECVARKSRLYALITQEGGHAGVELDAESLERLVTWMDVYAQRLGSFSVEQEQQLAHLRRQLSAILTD